MAAAGNDPGKDREEDEDPFDPLLHLEQTYHAEGYTLGLADGAQQGRIEGRTFGLEQGFSKFSALGRLGGRAAVWDARLASAASASKPDEVGGGETVPPLKGSKRLRRQVERLVELTDRESLSTVNDEESVNAFDDRLREANAKSTLVRKMAGEKESEGDAVGAKKGGGEMEDFSGVRGAAGKGASEG